ncbi:DNA mismatch repair endonuclease MutL [Anaerocolumna sp. MB42-C2]|uniref:DNA mismatch repair endonuclease MutL n=1 Tax=Anaerocolumna sp. MB42-C2 TaxID=3070997 RepID=UPI0027DF02EA|nr:DNA mismatch repair endonuclease MutL [Anaerocolumna sp. MB42-C2]WMJ88268.1 DNA mismatch repair endonuclease MutL [Anaerocolumna sp. MB42-C2]
MPKITVLDENTINQIAAGEVIERPAAVVKELVENAIDAGANAVTVEIKEGGISFIRITDNGSGIEKEDMPLVFLRHSTSKIRTAEDLLKVTSLGFRGEALSSIAAISQVELVTKTSESFTGLRYLIAGGEEKSLEHIGCPNGTTFIIRNLFYNTPARKKFLKSPVTEAGYINDLMERLAVSHPDVSFKFINNGQIRLHTSGNNNLKDIIYNVYGRDITANLLLAESSNEQISVEGYIAKPLVSRGNRNYENYYINGRYVKSTLISKAIEEAYRPFIMLHRYPFTSLHIRIKSELIDVNVHPAKLEIRFKNGEELYQLLYHTIKSTLEGKEMIPAVHLTEEKQEIKIDQKIPEPFEEKRRQEYNGELNNPPSRQESYKNQNKDSINSNRSDGNANFKSNENHVKGNYSTTIESGFQNKYSAEDKVLIRETEIGKLNEVVSDAPAYVKEEILSSQNKIQKEEVTEVLTDSPEYNKEPQVIDSAEQLSFLSEEAIKSHRIIGQVFSTYWIVEFGDKLFYIDQHAAHEKVLYEKIMKSLKEKTYTSQFLEPPIILSLTMREEEALKKHIISLNNIGFEIEAFGGKEYAVRAVPSDLFGLAQYEILIELIDGFAQEVYNDTPELILEKIASMSCKAAVKGNHRLSGEEAGALIEELLTLDNPYHCPHGRPTIISMSKYELEKKFKRIV